MEINEYKDEKDDLHIELVLKNIIQI